jgi:hypothetical protein
MIHEIFNVITSGEVIPRAGENHSSDAKVSGSLIEGSGEVCVHIPRQSIHLFGAIERDGQDAIYACGGDVTHG